MDKNRSTIADTFSQGASSEVPAYGRVMVKSPNANPTRLMDAFWLDWNNTKVHPTQWKQQEAWIFHMDTQSFNQLYTYLVIYNILFIYLLVKNCISIWCLMYLYLKGGGTWDWSQDPKQRSMLQKARNRGANIFQLFSNSPVWLVQGWIKS